MKNELTLEYIKESQKIISDYLELIDDPHKRLVAIKAYDSFEELKKYASS